MLKEGGLVCPFDMLLCLSLCWLSLVLETFAEVIQLCSPDRLRTYTFSSGLIAVLSHGASMKDIKEYTAFNSVGSSCLLTSAQ